MKVGFLTVGLSPTPLKEIIPWAAGVGFETLELGCWPVDLHHGFNTQLDVNKLTPARAAEILALCKEHQIDISCLTYCDNNLARDKTQRAAHVEHLFKVFEAATLLNVGTVCTFIGRDETRSIAENIQMAGQIFTPILKYAASHNLRLCVENCPMPGWQFEGLVGNVAHTPDVWDRLFKVLPYENFGLNLDPSHLHWLDIDPVRVAREYEHKIFYVHIKDVEILADQRYRRGILDAADGGWRRYRLPGQGEINFAAFIGALRQAGYNGPLSVELEDSGWVGTPEQVKQGLQLALSYLRETI